MKKIFMQVNCWLKKNLASLLIIFANKARLFCADIVRRLSNFPS